MVNRQRNATSIMGRSVTLWVADNYLVNTSTMVAYQGKPVLYFLQQEYHESTFDTTLTFSKLTSDNKNTVKLSEVYVLP